MFKFGKIRKLILTAELSVISAKARMDLTEKVPELLAALFAVGFRGLE